MCGVQAEFTQPPSIRHGRPQNSLLRPAQSEGGRFSLQWSQKWRLAHKIQRRERVHLGLNRQQSQDVEAKREPVHALLHWPRQHDKIRRTRDTQRLHIDRLVIVSLLCKNNAVSYVSFRNIGSEDNKVYLYSKEVSMPLCLCDLSYDAATTSVLQANHFVSAVCWSSVSCLSALVYYIAHNIVVL